MYNSICCLFCFPRASSFDDRRTQPPTSCPLSLLPHSFLTLSSPLTLNPKMNKLYSVEVRGRRVPIREHSFLVNPRTSEDIKVMRGGRLDPYCRV